MTFFLFAIAGISLVLALCCLCWSIDEPMSLVGTFLFVLMFIGAINQSIFNREAEDIQNQLTISQQAFSQLAKKYHTTNTKYLGLVKEAKGKDNVIAATNAELTKTRVKLSVASTEVTIANDKLDAMEETVNEAQDLVLTAQKELEQVRAISESQVKTATLLAEANKEKALVAQGKLDAIRGIL